MIAIIPSPDPPGTFHTLSGHAGAADPKQRSQPGRDISCHIVQMGRRPSEVDVFLVFVADHAVHRVDGFVGQSQHRAAEHHIEVGRDHAVGIILRDRFHRSPRHSVRVKRLGVPANDPRDCLAGRDQPGRVGALRRLLSIPVGQTAIHVLCFFGKPPDRDRLPAPQRVQQKKRDRMHDPRQYAKAGCDYEGRHRDQSRHHCACAPAAPRCVRKDLPQMLFEKTDPSSDDHHWVRQLLRIRKQQVQQKTKQDRQFKQKKKQDHRSAPALFLYSRAAAANRSAKVSPPSQPSA